MTEIDKEIDSLASEIFQVEQIINKEMQNLSPTKGDKLGFSTNLMIQNQRIYALLRFYPYCSNPSDQARDLYDSFLKYKEEKPQDMPQEVLDILNRKDG